jgi:uncharacterized protein
MVAATATPEPSQTLAPAARKLWRLEGGVGTLVALVPAILVQLLAGGIWALLAWVALAVFALFAIVLVPEVRWRRWRWEVREHEIDLRHGTWEVIRTLVPMARVQHVTTRRDPFQQALDLATVVVHTAAGANEIPALTVAEAARVRDRIAELARTPDEL